MQRSRRNIRLVSLLVMFCFLLSQVISFGLPNHAEANEQANIYTADEMAGKAVDFINDKYKAGEKIDGYTAYVLTLAGEDLSAGQWTSNGKTLKSEIENLADLLDDNNSLISYITKTQNPDGSFGPYANEYGTKVPLQALAMVKDDFTVNMEVYNQVQTAITGAVNYFKTRYQNGSMTYNVNGWNFDYRCVEALANAGENLSVGGWVYNGTSLRDIVIASADSTAKTGLSVKDAVYLAKEITVLNALHPDSDNIDVLAGAIVDKQKSEGNFGSTIYDHVMVLTTLGKTGKIGQIDQTKAFNFINNLKQAHKNSRGQDAGVAWGSTWGGSFHEEPDLTAQVITALSYFNGADTEGSDVNNLIHEGLAYLADVQDADTAAVPAQWDSTFATAETLIALKSLGKTYDKYAGDESPWVKKSKTKTIALCLLALSKWNDETRRDRLVNLLIGRQKPADSGKGSFENSVYSDMWAYIALGEAGKIDELNTNDARTYILSKQCKDDGSWGETFGATYYPDFMSTAQAMRALSYLPDAGNNPDIQAAINNGLAYLKSLQQNDGSVCAQYDDPAVDNSEIIITLRKLGKDPEGAEWTKTVGGKRVNPVSYLMTGTMNADGSFGTSKNVFGATEALFAYVLQKDADMVAAVKNGVQYLVDQYFSDNNNYMYKQYGGYKATKVLTLAGEDPAADKWEKDGKTLDTRIKEDAAALTEASDVTDIAKILIGLSGLKSQDSSECNRLIALIAAKQKDKGNFADEVIYNEMLPYLALTMADGWGSLSAANQTKAEEWLINAQTKADPNKGSWHHQLGVDTVSTAQAIVVLSGFADAETEGSDAYRAVQDGLAWLKSQQDDTGKISVQFDDPVTDTGEALLAVLAAGQNPKDPEWTKNGKNLLDYLLLSDNRNDDGSIGDKDNYSGNVGSTVPALMALLEYNNAYGWIDFNIVQDDGNNNNNNNPPGSGGTVDRYSVYIKVVGKNGEALYDGNVTVSETEKWGRTALGALHATGLNYTDDDGFVKSIAGQANSGMNGWMYKVDEDVPNVLACDRIIGEGDRVIWWYSTDPNSTGPSGGSSNSIANLAVENASDKAIVIQNKITSGTLSPSEAVNEINKIVHSVKNELASETKTSAADASKLVRTLLENTMAALVENNDTTVDLVVKALKSVINDGVKVVLARPDAAGVALEVKNSLTSQVQNIITRASTISSSQVEVSDSGRTTTISLSTNILEQQLEQIDRVQQELLDSLSGDQLQDVAVLARAPVRQLNFDLAELAGQDADIELMVTGDVAQNLSDSGVELALAVSDEFNIIISGKERVSRQAAFIKDKWIKLAALDGDKLPDLIASSLVSQNEATFSGTAGYVLSVSKLDSAEAEKLAQDANANSSAHVALRPVGKAYTVTIKEPVGKEVVSALTAPLKLKMSRQGLKNPEIAGIYRYQDGEFIFAGAKPDKFRKTINAGITTGGTFTLLEYDKKFTDLAGHWAEGDIRVLSARHIVSGVTPSAFGPGQTATRAQCAALLVRALDISKSDVGSGFSDVSESAWYAGDVAAAAKAGIIKGTSAGTFSPDKSISRAELAVMISRVLESKTGRKVSDIKETLAKYADIDQIPDWARGGMALAVESGIVNGRTADTIVPDGTVNRAEAAVMIGRLLENIE